MHGTVSVSGAKNAAVAIIPAALLSDGVCVIDNIPQIEDVKVLAETLTSLGATIKQTNVVEIDAPSLTGAEVYLDVVSVGATINIMLAAVKAEGTTMIFNCAKEPHVIDVANFLNNMGARIKGAGTDVIKIQGVKRLRSCNYTLIPDSFAGEAIR